eukprot:1689155-Rhodomonas_salina.2
MSGCNSHRSIFKKRPRVGEVSREKEEERRRVKVHEKLQSGEWRREGDEVEMDFRKGPWRG